MKQHPPDIIQTAVLDWFKVFGRKNLPWQHPISPYRVWVSEIMLQQTQVATVINYFNRFIDRLPTIKQLAQADQDTVLHLWTGLGYYARARNLHKSAQLICEKYNGKLPTSFNELINLPGIGRSTAGAILSIAMRTPTPILDGNVKRVLSRLHAVEGWPGTTQTAKQLWALAEHYTPNATDTIAQYTQAMMDIGATLCTRTQPKCKQCPLSTLCDAFLTGQTTVFPHKRPSKALAVRQATLLILGNDKGQILLKKRPPAGIWGGLWSFPELIIDENNDQAHQHCSQEDIIKRWCEQHYALTPTQISPQENLRHTFSHFHLDIYPVYVKVRTAANNTTLMEPDTYIWYDPNKQQQLGLPAPIKKLLFALYLH